MLLFAIERARERQSSLRGKSDNLILAAELHCNVTSLLSSRQLL